MIKRIICPVNFSDASVNATEYAAKLAQVFNVPLVLVNVEKIAPVTAAVSLGEGIGANIRENSLLASKRLSESAVQINKMFKISVDYEVDITTKSLAKTIASLGSESTMIVMGTNGADDMMQFFFGTNTYNVIKKSECPVLLVPENFTYKTYENILFAIPYREKSPNALEPFYEFADKFTAHITILHISEKDSDISRDVFNKDKNELEAIFNGKHKLTFKRAFSADIADAIEGYISTNSTDLLVMPSHHRNPAEILFRQKAVKTLSDFPLCPMLVVHV
ncbi:MAG: universal stress protein [Bacteroidia bacterium]